MTLTELVTHVDAWAIRKGWRDTPATVGERIALMHAELSEAIEEYRKGALPNETYLLDAQGTRQPDDGTSKPEGIPTELADVIIRIADSCGAYGIDLDRAVARKRSDWQILNRAPLDESFGDHIARLHHDLSVGYGWVLDGARPEEVFNFHWSDLKTRELDNGYSPGYGLPSELAAVVLRIEEMAAIYGFDLNAAIERKLAYNEKRAYRHGNRVI